jgi:hypothetical protein
VWTTRESCWKLLKLFILTRSEGERDFTEKRGIRTRNKSDKKQLKKLIRCRYHKSKTFSEGRWTELS